MKGDMPKGHAGVRAASVHVLSFPRIGEVGGAQVERVNPFSFFEFGKVFQEAQGYDVPPSAISAFLILSRMKYQIGRLLSGDPVPLGISRATAESVKSMTNDLLEEHFAKPGPDGVRVVVFPTTDDPQLPEWHWSSLKYQLNRFETVFGEELATLATYFVPTRGIYSTTALIDNADAAFPADVRGFIPDKAMADWRAAGRCLAFNLLSASGFHVARAVEACLEVYFQHFMQQPRATKNGWNDYIVALENSSLSEKASPKTIAELKQMKDDYRNPIVHPRVTLLEADARMLFNNGESLIIAMAQELKDAAVKAAIIGTSFASVSS
jgi:hypothetical protein